MQETEQKVTLVVPPTSSSGSCICFTRTFATPVLPTDMDRVATIGNRQYVVTYSRTQGSTHCVTLKLAAVSDSGVKPLKSVSASTQQAASEALVGLGYTKQ